MSATATLEPPAAPGLFLRVFPPIVLPVFLAVIDQTIVAAALPSMARGLGGARYISWVVVAYLIAATIAAPGYGRLGDLFGRRQMIVTALSLFAAASALCALAPNLPVLILGRALQGLGGGGLMTLSQALLAQGVPGRERGRYQGYLAGIIVAGSAFGPVAGGLLTQGFGWRSVFLINLPLAALAALLILRLVPRPAAPEAARGGSFDGFGMILLTATVAPLLMALEEAQHLSERNLALFVALSAGTLAAGAALGMQQRRARTPLLALHLLRDPSFWRADLMAACSGASLTTMVTFLPIYLQLVGGTSPAQSGLLLIPLTVSVSSGSVITGWLASRTRRTAIWPACGLMITVTAMLLLAGYAQMMGPWLLAMVLAAGGLCQGSAMLVAQITAQAVAGPAQLGAAAGSVQLCRALGSAFGVALSGTVLFAVLHWMDPATARLFLALLRHGRGALENLDPGARMAALARIVTGFRFVFAAIAVFGAVIVAAAATMPLRRM
ncbi:MAG: MFS transporter [Rhodospirillales bacterium]|nr:MFS transporter [Rhodospirillales bacterium]